MRQKIENLKRQLREIIEPDNVFLNQLIKQGVLTEEFKNKVLLAPIVPERNDLLLKWLLSDFDGDYSHIVKAFIETKQQHVVNYISADGGNLGYTTFVLY